MFVLKKLIGLLTAPLTLAFGIFAIGLMFRLLGRRRAAIWLWAAAATLAYLASTAWVGDALLSPLEQQYPPLSSHEALSKVRYIVVLGSGYAPREGIPITAALDTDGLTRAVEGIRLTRQLGVPHLVLSGGALPGRVPSAIGYALLARSLGVDPKSLIVLDRPLDTPAESRAIAALIHDEPYVLVTSAYHMPRAVRLMRRAGTRPIPAPTEQRVDRERPNALLLWLPSSNSLRKSECALHEYLGLLAMTAGLE